MRGRRRILVRGRTMVRAAVLIAALLLLPPLLRGAPPGVPRVTAAVMLLAAAAFLRRRWWVFLISRTELNDAVTRSCRMALARVAVSADGASVAIANAQLLIRVRARGPQLFELDFAGPWDDHRKARLLRSLIAKQFDPLLPRITIRLRR